MVSSNNQDRIEFKEYQQELNIRQFRNKGLEEKTSEKLERLKYFILENVNKIKWVTSSEFDGNKLIYNIRKGSKAFRECELLKTSFRIILEREFGSRNDLIASLIYKTENEQKGRYSISIELTADDEEKALYEIASKLNDKLFIYLSSQK